MLGQKICKFDPAPSAGCITDCPIGETHSHFVQAEVTDSDMPAQTQLVAFRQTARVTLERVQSCRRVELIHVDAVETEPLERALEVADEGRGEEEEGCGAGEWQD